jgi:hypothetical protein
MPEQSRNTFFQLILHASVRNAILLLFELEFGFCYK